VHRGRTGDFLSREVETRSKSNPATPMRFTFDYSKSYLDYVVLYGLSPFLTVGRDTY
jgi:hypothetical protein